VHRNLKDVVACLGGGNVSGIKVGANFIMAFSFNGGIVRTLVDVLMDVLDSLDRATDLQVDVTVEFNQELSWMRNHSLVVKNILTLLNGPAIFRASIIRIAILLNDGMITEGLWKVLFANTPLQASLRRTWTSIYLETAEWSWS
jgi:hypothetical protein